MSIRERMEKDVKSGVSFSEISTKYLELSPQQVVDMYYEIHYNTSRGTEEVDLKDLYIPERMIRIIEGNPDTFNIHNYMYIHPLLLLKRDYKILRRLTESIKGREVVNTYLENSHLREYYNNFTRDKRTDNFEFPTDPILNHLTAYLNVLSTKTEGHLGGRINNRNNKHPLKLKRNADEFIIGFIESCINVGIVRQYPKVEPKYMVYNPNNPDSKKFNRIRTLYNSMINGGWSYSNYIIESPMTIHGELYKMNQILADMDFKAYSKYATKFRKELYETEQREESENRNYFLYGHQIHMEGELALLNSVLWFIKIRNDITFQDNMEDILNKL